MHKLLLIALLSVCGFTARAQKIRFSDTSNVWTVRSTHFDDPYGRDVVFRWGRDTLINNMTYRYLRGSGQGSIPLTDAWVREDTAAGKLYFIRVGISPARRGDSVEWVLFDYNLNVGDTFRVDYGSLHAIHFVQGLDSTTINGVVHRIWQLQGVRTSGSAWNYPYLFIEGIGTTRHPLFSGYPSVFENGETMYCFRQLGKGNPIPAPAVNWNGRRFTNDCKLDIPFVAGSGALESKIVPNPATDMVTLTLSRDLVEGRLRVFDATGRTVLVQSLAIGESFRFPVARFAPGMYYFRVSDDERGVQTGGRFIVR